MAYIIFEKKGDKIIGKGPIAKFFNEAALKELIKICNISKNSVFFICNKNEADNFQVSLDKNS